MHRRDPQHPAEGRDAPTAIRIRGARTHNLKDISIDLPHNQLTVITGVSGSGKSSLAFDTLYAEGQRQYIESLSAYARQFLNQLQRPDVDLIEGLQPTLCIDQRAGLGNPRSTVATVTEVYDYLRLLMARAGKPHCYRCGKPILQQSPEQIQARLMGLPERTKLVLMAPVVRGRRGAHRDALESIRKAGLLRVRIDSELYDIDAVPELAVRKNHSIEAVVDKIVIRPGSEGRLAESLRLALRLAGGLASVSYLTPESASEQGPNDWTEQLFSTLYSCPDCDISYEELEPRTFSFNSPYGACPACDGVGVQAQFDPDLLVRDWNKPPATGLAVLEAVSGAEKRKLTRELKKVFSTFEIDWKASLKQLTAANRRKLWHGDSNRPGVIATLERLLEGDAEQLQPVLEDFRENLPCSACQGTRLRTEALAVTLNDYNIHDICSLAIADALAWFEELDLDLDVQPIANPILRDVLHRLRFLIQVGVGYLALNRSAESLSGGELQRVRLASSIGSGLVGVCYVLDEPSIGLHQRDNGRLIESLRKLQQQGNTVLVVEHDEAMMRAADRLVDIGPGAGTRGGEVVAEGDPEDVAKNTASLTAAYLRGDAKVSECLKRRPPDKSQMLKLRGARLHNLKNVAIDVPLGLLVGVTGVSGSGKSSLFGETLVPAVARKLGQSAGRPGPFKSLSGDRLIDKLIQITQAPIGRTPRSTPATYCGVFDLIRNVWAGTRDAKQRGYSVSRFSFNAGPGRCAQCQGQGQEKIEMNFLPDLFVTCSACNGLRFNRQTLQVRYREKSIADVLEMSVDEATEFFQNFSKIHRLLSSLEQVGLGYLSLGQSSTTLSGGESQRIKLATELARPETGRTIYFLDEPTTGLHFADIKRLIKVLNGLVNRGNTVIVIEHNLDVIQACDWLIDLGPEGGDNGGEVIVSGPPEVVSECPQSLTGKYLCTDKR